MALITLGAAPVYVAALGDSVLRGDMLPTCYSTTAPCPSSFFDLATLNRGGTGIQFDYGLDGRDAGELSPRAGVIGEELPKYCGAHVAFDFTVVHTAINDVRRWQGGFAGNVTLQQSFNTYYVGMIRQLRACHPETKLILIGADDIAYRCDHALSAASLTQQARYNEYNGYIKLLAATTANTKFLDTWGAHSAAHGLGTPVSLPGKPWYYGPDWYGIVNGVDTGGNCVHPGLIGHQYIARSLIATMWPFP